MGGGIAQLYADKGVTVSPDDLAALQAGFAGPVPVLVEHAESPLELGFLTEVAAVGSELFGTLALSPEASALIERSEARALSIGLTPDLRSIREVSLVRFPRVADARLFDGVRFDCALPVPLSHRCRALESELLEAKVRREVEELIRQGRLTPAQAQFAEALLRSPDLVAFDGGSQPVRLLVLHLLRSAPTSRRFEAQAPDPAVDLSSPLLMPEEAAFYRRYFPDVPLEQIAHVRSRPS